MDQELTMWAGRKVAILMPVYRSFNPDTHYTLFANYARYGPEKIAIPKPVKRTCIWEARSMLVDKAYKTMPDAEYYIMPDDDMIFPYGYAANFNQDYGSRLPDSSAGLNAISRIMSHGPEKGIVGALYFGRHAKGRAQCDLGFKSDAENKNLREGKYSGLVPMLWVGTGFIRIARWVIKEMRDAIDQGQWPECKPANESRWYGYFQPLRVGVGEDVSFCTRAKAIGIQSYLDSTLVCLHNGECNFGPNNVKD